MKILVYGDSNSWGYVPNKNGYSQDAILEQYSKEQIWWHQLTKNNFVVVNALCGRTAFNDDPLFDGRNASKTLDDDLGDEQFDLAVIMLGTNDCKSVFDSSAIDIAGAVVDIGKRIEQNTGAKVLVVSPPILCDGTKIVDKYYIGGSRKIAALDCECQKLAKANGFYFVSGLFCPVGEDGEHLTKEGHQMLGESVANFVDEYIAKTIKQENDEVKTM